MNQEIWKLHVVSRDHAKQINLWRVDDVAGGTTVLGGQVKTGQWWTGQNRPVNPGRRRVPRERSGLQVAR